MKVLQELAALNARIKVVSADILGLGKSDSLPERFYAGLLQEAYEDAEEVMEDLFETPTGAYKFASLKHDVKSKLIDRLFFFDPSPRYFNDIQRAYYRAYKEFAAIKILAGRQYRNAYVHMAEKLLPTARQYDFTSIVLELSRMLLRHYAAHVGNRKKMAYYRSLVEEYVEIMRLELRAEVYYSELTLHYSKFKSRNEEVHNKAQEYYEWLKPHLTRVRSFNFHRMAYQVGVILYASINDYRGVRDLCTQALSYFDGLPYDHIQVKRAMLNFQFDANLQLNEFDECRAILTRSGQMVDESSMSWFRVQELSMLLYLRSGSYDQAVEIFELVSQNRALKRQPKNVQERWNLHEAYLNLLQEMSKVSLSASPSRFRLARFINDTPRFSNDKRAMNIPLIIAQLAFYLLDKNEGKILEKIEALEKYSTRYLRKNDNFRSNCFIKMLLTIPKHHFHRTAVERHAKRYRDRLESVPLNMANQAAEIEIIPYEDLWEMILTYLDKPYQERASSVKRRDQLMGIPGSR